MVESNSIRSEIMRNIITAEGDPQVIDGSPSILFYGQFLIYT